MDPKEIKKLVVFIIILSIIVIPLNIYFAVCDQKEQEDRGIAKVEIEEYSNSLKEEYNINFIYGNQSIAKLQSELTTTNITLCQDEVKVAEAIKSIEKIVKRLPSGFWDEICKEDDIRLRMEYVDIYLCSKIDSEYTTESTYETGGFNYYSNDKGLRFMIDIERCGSVEITFAHELYHSLEDKIICKAFEDKAKGVEKISYILWSDCNPDNYEYWLDSNEKNSLNKLFGNRQYCESAEDSLNNVYFPTDYATYSEDEDRAEVFEYLLASEAASDLPSSFDSPHVQAKAKLIVDMLDETFDSVDDTAYWNQIYKEKYED